MKTFELLLEHRYKNQLIEARRIKGSDHLVTLGSSHTADLHLFGEQIGGIHAVIQFEKDRWVLSDTGSGNGTWVEKTPIIEMTMKNGSIAHIGEHELRFITHTLDTHLFDKDQESVAKGDVFHQVVMRVHGQILETHLLGQNQPFVFHDGKKSVAIAPSKDFVWSTEQHGAVEIQHRLVRNAHHIESPRLDFKTLLSREYRVPAAIVASVLFLIVLAIALAPHAPDAHLQTVSLDNPYAKLIYDSKLNKQRKSQSQQLTKKMKDNKASGDPGAGVAKPREGEVKTPTTKVVRNIQSAKLGALIGRISKRAAATSFAVPMMAGPAGHDNNANAITTAAVGAVAKQTGTSGAVGSYKIGAVGTIGKGGGRNLGKGLAGLGEGGVGSADVGFSEEEGEVEGGLDREVIAKYIKSQLGQIRYCYERQLSANPDLYGKIQIKFTISASGAVTSQAIGTSTLKNAMVEGCILRRVASWKFPEPKNGTAVLVTYPFLFRSTN